MKVSGRKLADVETTWSFTQLTQIHCTSRSFTQIISHLVSWPLCPTSCTREDLLNAANRGKGGPKNIRPIFCFIFIEYHAVFPNTIFIFFKLFYIVIIIDTKLKHKEVSFDTTKLEPVSVVSTWLLGKTQSKPRVMLS